MVCSVLGRLQLQLFEVVLLLLPLLLLRFNRNIDII